MHKKPGFWIVTGILLLGLGGYVAISLVSPETKDLTQVRKNYAASEAIRLLGPDARLLHQVEDIDADGQKETVAYKAMPNTAQRPSTADSGWIYARSFYVLKHTPQKTFTVIRAEANGVRNERDQPFAPATAPYGYWVARDSLESGAPVFVFYLADSLGQVASDPLPIGWDAAASRYQLMLP
ncbi:MAG: hypothetical protein ACK52I_34435 [Pseudomonadota bacterium]